MKEHPNNIGYVCEKHAPRARGLFMEQDLEWFMGKFCKLAFKTRDGIKTEHMWVKVVRLCEKEDEELVGILDNDPVCDVEYKYGDELAFSRVEIEDAFDPDSPVI